MLDINNWRVCMCDASVLFILKMLSPSPLSHNLVVLMLQKKKPWASKSTYILST